MNYITREPLFNNNNNKCRVVQGIRDWLWEGSLLTNGRWDGPQKVLLLTDLIYQWNAGPVLPMGPGESGARTHVSLPPPSPPSTLPVATPNSLPPTPPRLDPSIRRPCLPFGRQPSERWVTSGVSDLSAFCPHLAWPVSLAAPLPPRVSMLPRRRPGQTCLGWRDGTFGSLDKEGREIESDTWQGRLPGQHAGEAGRHPG